MPASADDWTAFLGRTPGPLDTSAIRREVEGKVVVITGAGGFIGSALARALAVYLPAHLVLLDVAERGLHELAISFPQPGSTPPSYELVLGDICDAVLLQQLFSLHRPHIVFHAAALKHVWLVESNPLEAARVNVLGSRSVLNAAAEAGAERFILVSTDKAVEPAGFMGATKRVAELLVLASAGATRAHAMRLGNVLGSTGSVAPMLEQQIAGGLPLTLTDRACTRYFLSIEEVMGSLLSALLVDQPAAILIPDPGPPRLILDLAGFLVERAGRCFVAADVTYSGLRPGEKVAERLIADDEVSLDTKLPGVRFIKTLSQPTDLHLLLNEVSAAVQQRDTQALLRVMAEILPNFRPSPTLLRYAEAAEWQGTA